MSHEISRAESSPWTSLAQRLRPLRAAWPTVASLLCLGGSWLALRRGFFAHADIPLWDETEYLASGWRLLHHADMSTVLPGSPLYVLWYALWHLLLRDPIVVLYGQWLLIDLLLAVSVYFAMRAGGASGLFAYLVATYWSALVCVWDPPRVGFFALLMVLLAVLAEYRGKRVWAILLLAAAALSRPEYLLVVLLWLLIRSWPRLGRRSRLVVIAGTLVITLLALAGAVPGLGSERIWSAFAQHYALRWAAEHPSMLAEPWADWAQAVAISFPGAHSIGDAFLSNAREVLHHVAGNLFEYPSLLVTLVASPALPGIVVGPAILCGLLFAVAARRRWPQPVAWRTPTLLIVACVSALPSLFVKPKAVYCLPLVLLILIGMARVARSLGSATVGLRDRLGVGMCAAATLALWFVPPPLPATLPIAGTISSLRSIWSQLGPSPEWRMLEADGGFCTYVDFERCRALQLLKKPAGTTFADYLREVNANAVLVSDNFRNYTGVRHDPGFARFASEPSSFGFRLVMANPQHAFFLKVPKPIRSE
jgi:hypothetical protein